MKDVFLTNYSETTFLNKIIDSLKKCKSFSFSVSFVKKAGLVLFEKIMEEALKRGVKGRFITSTYQNFTDIASLRTFLRFMFEYPNFECHLDINCFGDKGFHTKGYLFEYDGSFEFIVGSTNITRFALMKNVEWNVALSSPLKTNSAISAYKEFDELWTSTKKLSNELIKQYQLQLDYAIDKWDMDYFDPVSISVKPNAMQRKALKELRRYRDMGVKKSLVISATGSGKTYLAAFDARNYNADKLLFVVHRDKILVDAKDTFMKVFGSKKTYGLFVGKHKEIECDFIFASNVMLEKHLSEFKDDAFDYIVFDECHHAAAQTYKKIMEYFKPGFMLGITATPERMDNQDVFEMFERNVPYELRLRDAIINDLVVPFHYYGIRDKLVDYKSNDKAIISKEIAKVENIDFICEQIEKHRPIGKLKALAFCTSIAHAQLMAEELEESGYPSVALSGNNDLGQRIKAFNNLQDDDNPLEIICAVDILNEGVDIPQVNMILFLRPTESSTIFLQQLGRGLRKYEGKQYVTILDFIGNNYDRSIQMAMALGTLGQSTIIEKNYLIDMLRTNFKSLNIPGVNIVIDDLSKEEIIDFIKRQNFNRSDFLKKDYENFKVFLKVETYPKHLDYLNNDCAPDLLRFMKSKLKGTKNMSYYQFLQKIGEESLPIFSETQIELVNKISELLPIVRVDEIIIINQLLTDGILDLNSLVNFNKNVTIETLNHAKTMLENENVIRDESLNVDSMNEEFVNYLDDLISYALQRFDIEFGEFNTKFKLYGNYYKEQIMRVLLQSKLMFMKGTKFDDDGTTYVFVGLKKDKDKQDRTNYKDKFLSPIEFQWESENNTTITNSVGKKLINTKVVHLFVRKMDDEDGVTLPFTYFGTGKFTNMRDSYVEVKEKDGTTKSVPTLLFDILLDNDVKEEYYFDFEIPDVKVVC